jgi:hypothetical protein
MKTGNFWDRDYAGTRKGRKRSRKAKWGMTKEPKGRQGEPRDRVAWSRGFRDNDSLREVERNMFDTIFALSFLIAATITKRDSK